MVAAVDVVADVVSDVIVIAATHITCIVTLILIGLNLKYPIEIHITLITFCYIIQKSLQQLFATLIILTWYMDFSKHWEFCKEVINVGDISSMK